ncbi:MAG: tetratricopeptide repeat protein [Desulfomonile sp.]|nr:tetratricopeptide repeat protein [Desulfomonile sp.]
MVEKKVTRKELLKEPDEFITLSGRALQFARENPRTVTGICIAVVVAIVGAAVIYGYQHRMKTLSHEQFQKVYPEYRLAVDAQEPVTNEKLEQLFKKFDAIATEFPNQLGGEMALLYSAHVLYRMGDYKGALDRYTRMQSTSLVGKGLGNLLLYHLAMTRLALKEYEEAKSLFDTLSKDTNSPYRREALVATAGIYEAMGKNKEAVQAYRQYLKMFPQAPDAPYVRTRIADLSSPE